MRALIIVSFLVAFLLTVVAIDSAWHWCRPEFVSLLVIYWSIFAPQHFGLLSAWIVGIFLDLLQFSPLGFHAIGMLLVSYISLLLHRRIRNYVLWHQALWVFFLVVIYQLLTRWLGSFYGKVDSSPFPNFNAVEQFSLAFISGFYGPVISIFSLALLKISWRNKNLRSV